MGRSIAPWLVRIAPGPQPEQGNGEVPLHSLVDAQAACSLLVTVETAALASTPGEPQDYIAHVGVDLLAGAAGVYRDPTSSDL